MIIDGKHVALLHRNKLKVTLEEFYKKHPNSRPPGCAFILVGENKASHAYVNMKKKGCEEVGITSFVYQLAESATQNELLDLIHFCNDNKNIDGILVQQPLPPQFDGDTIINSVHPDKDVDGFHPLNIGKTLLGQEDSFYSCTPYGILKLLEHYDLSPQGQHVVILGRSNIVGKPLASMLIQKKSFGNATVTVAHSQTKNLSSICQSADILIVAIGTPLFVKKEMVKPGAVVIDVGINAVVKEGGYQLVGDVDFNHVAPLCKAITPVPGGVGPMTIAMLLTNTLLSFTKREMKTTY